MHQLQPPPVPYVPDLRHSSQPMRREAQAAILFPGHQVLPDLHPHPHPRQLLRQPIQLIMLQ